MTPSPLDDYKEFNRQLDRAHGEFAASVRHLGNRVPLAVQAARFNQFIILKYPELSIITPDACEEYLNKVAAIKRATGAATKDELLQEIRSLEVLLAYKEFRRTTRFKGTDAAEAIAFETFASRDHPELGDVSGAEAKTAKDTHNKYERNSLYMSIGLGLLSLAFLVGSHVYSKTCSDKKVINSQNSQTDKGK